MDESELDNDTCLLCHGEEDFVKEDEEKGEISLFIDEAIFSESSHNKKACIDCHSDITEIPHEKPGSVRCVRCHFSGNKELKPSIAADEYEYSIHAQARQKGKDAATCKDCHGKHDIFPKTDVRSKVHRLNIPYQCANCHADRFKQYSGSVHGILALKGKRLDVAVCIDCHSSHKIETVKTDKWKSAIVTTCGNCHTDRISSYRKSFHGKFNKLGMALAARCPDCHGTHNIYRVKDSRALVSEQNRLNTCKKCHKNAQPKFTQYRVHATENDRIRYPFIFYTYWGMLIFITTVFMFFLMIAIFWFIKEIKERFARKDRSIPAGERYLRRFTGLDITLHSIVIVTFTGLVLTGILIRFSGAPWASPLENILGGIIVSRIIHRLCAIATFTALIIHVVYVFYKIAYKRKFRFSLVGELSLVLNKNDIKNFFQHIKWLRGKGERPYFGHWTYWEKFEYWGFFWGLFIVGSTGLVLWIPEFFSGYISGLFFNLATILHDMEAILASLFIFIIHFFFVHLRPEKFPMDPVIFTGRISESEMKIDRPKEYDFIMSKAQVTNEFMDETPPKWFIKYLITIGYIAIFMGLTLVFLIFWALIKGSH